MGQGVSTLTGYLLKQNAQRYPVSMRVNLVKNDDPQCALELKGQSVTA